MSDKWEEFGLTSKDLGFPLVGDLRRAYKDPAHKKAETAKWSDACQPTPEAYKAKEESIFANALEEYRKGIISISCLASYERRVKEARLNLARLAFWKAV